ncbi:hypothetical protein PR048_003752 [Dryococelus australis]|uniref:Tc1-like transposase DDE domain-containing protein n=1 Tax=Dryococelus australis TaxID=614101 RepID=A0ABQ9INY4_9NEOP|nr:hypothetical protein PR048_003752 [Dryococelus australis]
MFQQDNARSHRAADVQDWFEEHSREFQQMEWPACSPDMNLIEYLWDVEKRAIRTRDPAPRNIRELWAVIHTVWLDISPEIFRPLVESMPRQVTALLRARGGPTREVSMEQPQSVGAGEPGDPQENAPNTRLKTTPTCENPGAIPQGNKSVSSWWEASSLTTTSPRPLLRGQTAPLRSNSCDDAPSGELPLSQNEHYHASLIRLVWIWHSPCDPAGSLGRRVAHPRVCGGVVVRLLASHQGEPGSIPDGIASRLRHVGMPLLGAFSRGSPGPPPLHPGAAPYSPRFTLIGSQDLDVKSRPNIFTRSL